MDKTPLNKISIEKKFPDIWQQAYRVFADDGAVLDFLQKPHSELKNQSPLECMNNGGVTQVEELIQSGANGLIL